MVKKTGQKTQCYQALVVCIPGIIAEHTGKIKTLYTDDPLLKLKLRGDFDDFLYECAGFSSDDLDEDDLNGTKVNEAKKAVSSLTSQMDKDLLEFSAYLNAKWVAAITQLEKEIPLDSRELTEDARDELLRKLQEKNLQPVITADCKRLAGLITARIGLAGLPSNSLIQNIQTNLGEDFDFSNILDWETTVFEYQQKQAEFDELFDDQFPESGSSTLESCTASHLLTSTMGELLKIRSKNQLSGGQPTAPSLPHLLPNYIAARLQDITSDFLVNPRPSLDDLKEAFVDEAKRILDLFPNITKDVLQSKFNVPVRENLARFMQETGQIVEPDTNNILVKSAAGLIMTEIRGLQSSINQAQTIVRQR